MIYAQISGEHLQDHWSSCIYFSMPIFVLLLMSCVFSSSFPFNVRLYFNFHPFRDGSKINLVLIAPVSDRC